MSISKKMQRIISAKSIVPVLFVFGLLVSQSALAQNWTPPTTNPPGTNTPSPVNTGSAAQTKAGKLNLTGGVNIQYPGVQLGAGKILQDVTGNGDGTWQIFNPLPTATNGQTLRWNQALNGGAGAWEPNSEIINAPATGNITLSPPGGAGGGVGIGVNGSSFSKLVVSGTSTFFGDVLNWGNSTFYGAGSSAVSSAALEVSSNSQGFLAPAMNSASMYGILNPRNGLMVYNLTANEYYYYDQAFGAWRPIGAGVGGTVPTTANNGDTMYWRNGQWDADSNLRNDFLQGAITVGNTFFNSAGFATVNIGDGAHSIKGVKGGGLLAGDHGFTVSGSEVTQSGKNATITIENTASQANGVLNKNAAGFSEWNLKVGSKNTSPAVPSGGFVISDALNNQRFTIDDKGRVGINTALPDRSAALDISSTTGGLLAPRMTTAQRQAIATPADGLVVYDTGAQSLYFYDSANTPNWLPISGGGPTIDPGTNPGDTLVWDGVNVKWAKSNFLFNNGTSIGIGTTTPSASNKIEVAGDALLNGNVVIGDPSLASGPKTLSVIGNALIGTNTPTFIPGSNPPQPYALEVGFGGTAKIPNVFSNGVVSNVVSAANALCLGTPTATCLTSWPSVNSYLPTGATNNETLRFDSATSSWVKSKNILNDEANNRVALGRDIAGTSLNWANRTESNGDGLIVSSLDHGDIILNSKSTNGGTPAIYVGGNSPANLGLRISSAGTGDLSLNGGGSVGNVIMAGGGAVGIGPNANTLLPQAIAGTGGFGVPNSNLKLYVNGNANIGGYLYTPDVFTNTTNSNSFCLGVITSLNPCITAWSQITPASNLLLPTGGLTGDTLRYDGTNWIKNNFLFNDETSVGVGTKGVFLDKDSATSGIQPYSLQVGDSAGAGSMVILGSSSPLALAVGGKSLFVGETSVWGNFGVNGKATIGNPSSNWARLNVDGSLILNNKTLGGNSDLVLDSLDPAIYIPATAARPNSNLRLGSAGTGNIILNGTVSVNQNGDVNVGKGDATITKLANGAPTSFPVCADSDGTLVLCQPSHGNYDVTGAVGNPQYKAWNAGANPPGTKSGSWPYSGSAPGSVTFTGCGSGGGGGAGGNGYNGNYGSGGGGGGAGRCQTRTIPYVQSGTVFSYNVGTGGDGGGPSGWSSVQKGGNGGATTITLASTPDGKPLIDDKGNSIAVGAYVLYNDGGAGGDGGLYVTGQQYASNPSIHSNGGSTYTAGGPGAPIFCWNDDNCDGSGGGGGGGAGIGIPGLHGGDQSGSYPSGLTSVTPGGPGVCSSNNAGGSGAADTGDGQGGLWHWDLVCGGGGGGGAKAYYQGSGTKHGGYGAGGGGGKLHITW